MPVIVTRITTTSSATTMSSIVSWEVGEGAAHAENDRLQAIRSRPWVRRTRRVVDVVARQQILEHLDTALVPHLFAKFTHLLNF